MSLPLVSIIVPVHNRAGELRQALASVRAQTSGNWELVIVDDRSTDGAFEVAQQAAAGDARIRLIRSTIAGAPAARNAGVSSSTGELVVFLDSDDLLHECAVEWRLQFMSANPTLDFVVHRCELFFDSPGDANVLWNADNKIDDLMRFVARDMPWQTTSPTWRRTALAKVGEWKTDILSGQDWEFHIRALAKGLSYARDSRVDHYWRLPGPTRDSIGKTGWMSAQYAYARFDCLTHVVELLRSHARWKSEFRDYLAGHWFEASWWLAHRFNHKDGRSKWRQARTLGLVDNARYWSGSRKLWGLKWGVTPDAVMAGVRRDWPVSMHSNVGPLYNVAPMSDVVPGANPAVSVVMSAYNVEKYVELAVQSVREQTWRDFEFIIVDDGSTDTTPAILKDLASRDGRIKLITRGNKGLTVSLNEALAMARGEFVARMDADDIAIRDRFRLQLAYLRQNPDCVLVGSKVTLIDPYGVQIVEGEHVANHADIDRDMMLGKNPVYHPSVMMRRDALRRVGDYAEKYNNAEDLDLFLKLAEVGRLHNLDEILLHYRRHPGSVNHTKFENQWKLVKQIVADAHARRGLAMPADWGYEPWTPQPHLAQVKLWGWRALQQGNRRVARRHAIDAVRHGVLDKEAWKLLACAIRGR